MGNMYNEVVTRRKLPVLFKLLITMIVFIVLSDLTKGYKIGRYDMGNILTIVLITMMGVFMVSELLKCRIRYKYCVIGDKFVIHKVVNNEDKIVENIKIKDIQCIGKCKKVFVLLDLTNLNKYVCSLVSRDVYYCRYYENDKFRKFYFEPSVGLLETINHILSKSIAG